MVPYLHVLPKGKRMEKEFGEIPVGTSGKTAIEVARSAAIKAGQILLEKFLHVERITFKGRGNIVTEVDMEVQEEIFGILAAEFPEMKLLGEESPGEKADCGYVWIVDPLDGTRNYASGIPFFSTVVGLALDGEVLVGVNYDPQRNEMFEAEKGKGAFLNQHPIEISNKKAIKDAVIGMDMSYDEQGAMNGFEVIESIWPEMQTVRIMGSSALGISYAAAGRTDLYFNHQLSPWDQVAGVLLVSESGGIITDRTGKKAGVYSDGLVASNRALHQEFMNRTEGMNWRKTRE
jgi:myo-inositol-1(or 4)-monophosphatase